MSKADYLKMKFYSKHTLVILVLFFDFFNTAGSKVQGQCSGSQVSYFPATVNGVTITQTYTGDVTYAGVTNTWSNCGVTSGPTTLGNAVLAGSPFIQALAFSTPVNNLVYILTAPDSTSYACETFSFTVDAGSLTCVQGGSSCPLVQNGNTFYANSTNTIGTYITLISSQPYNGVTVSGSGGANGSCMSLCQNSIGFSGIFGMKGINFYPNPAQEKLNLEGSTELDHISIMNSIGQVVFQFQSHQKSVQLDISQLPKGLYLLKASIGSARFLKE